MDKFTSKVVAKFQQYRSKKLGNIGKALIRIGVSANFLTTLSLISGILSIYYLFDNYIFFIVFAVLHIIFDAFDGVVARLTKATNFGKYYDTTADHLPVVLALIKVGWVLQNFYLYIIVGLFILTFTIYFLSRLKSPILGMRSATLIVLAIGTFPGIIYSNQILIIGSYILGGFCIYSLIKQIRWYLRKRK